MSDDKGSTCPKCRALDPKEPPPGAGRLAANWVPCPDPFHESEWLMSSGEPTRLEEAYAANVSGDADFLRKAVFIERARVDRLVAREARVRALVETFRTKSVNAGKAMVDGVFDEDSVLAERMQGAAIAHGEDSAALEAALSDPEVK